MKKKQSKRRRKRTNKVPGWIEKQRKLNEPAPLNKKWSIEEKDSILDYLHGDIAADEVAACCYYEYARESETLRKARREYDPADPENSSFRVLICFPGWIYGQSCFWQCPHYPALPWPELSAEERENILPFYRSPATTPVVRDVRMLKGSGVLDALVQQAKDELTELNQRSDNPHAFTFSPAIASDPMPFIKHVIITINYMDGVDAVKEQIAHWLASGENQKLFKKYHKKPIDKQNLDSTSHYKELLKFLATWRLHDELGFEAAKEWTKNNRHRKDYHALPFFREKLRKTPHGKHYTGAVFKERRQWEDAIATAKSDNAIETHEHAGEFKDW
jgi:hypothetical protein